MGLTKKVLYLYYEKERLPLRFSSRGLVRVIRIFSNTISMTIDSYFYLMESQNDFEFVVRVLDSVKTREQLTSAQRLFENFKNKWFLKVESVDMIDYIKSFQSKLDRLVETPNLRPL